MNTFWKAAFTVCGLAAVGAFVFYTLYMKYLSLPVFSQMTPTQTFVLMLVFLGLTFLALIVMLITYYATKYRSANPDSAIAALRVRAESVVAGWDKAIDELAAAMKKSSPDIKAMKQQYRALKEQFLALHNENIRAIGRFATFV